MSALTRPLTDDDLIQTPDDLNRHEQINGDLLVSPSPRRWPQRLVYLPTRAIGDLVDANRLGQVLPGPDDVRLNQHTVVVPDLISIQTGRLSVFQRSTPGASPLVTDG